MRFNFNYNYLHEIAYHVNNGSVIVSKHSLLKATCVDGIPSKDIPQACFRLSKLTKRYVDYYPSTSSQTKDKVLLEMEKVNEKVTNTS
jgi:hypothetical protein